MDRAAIRSLDHCLLSVRCGLGDRLAIQAAISAVTHLALDTAHLRQHESADAQEQRSNASAEGNARKMAIAKDRHAEWQAEANLIWGRRPNLTKSDVARKVANCCGGDPSYIRQRLKK